MRAAAKTRAAASAPDGKRRGGSTVGFKGHRHDDGRGFVSFEQLDGQCVNGGDLAR
jgi:hypothetical protein